MLARSLLIVLLLSVLAPAMPTRAATFGVAAHSDVAIEWWYVNAHVTTKGGRHLAVIGSFFRFGSGESPLDPGRPAPRAYYLIYAVTDLDHRTHRSYSLADPNMVALLHQFAPLLALTSPNDRGVRALLAALNAGRLPAGNQLLSGPVAIRNTPFRLAYGTRNSLKALDPADTSFAVDLGSPDGGDTVHLTLDAEKPPMAVGGSGDTGLTKPTDMHYFSLTRCRVGGTINTGSGSEKIAGGEGWFDHQWGDSWVAQNDGWDWWGVQLGNGMDILFFRQRDLSTGRIFFPLATFMDRDGHQSVTKDIVFSPEPASYWTSPASGVTYPLAWDVTFPAQRLRLRITTSVPNQEMQILGPGGAIWEGSCQVTATPLSVRSGRASAHPAGSIPGVGYMELVGYDSPAIKARMAKRGQGR